MSNFDYEIQGVSLTDPRGAWNLLPGTDVLPKYPGINATKFNIPGASGESQVQHAPILPSTQLFVMRFHAIDTLERSPTYLKMGRDFDEKLAFLERNINQFMFATRLGAQSHLGNVELRRISHSAGDASSDFDRLSNRVLTAVGRVHASTEPQIASNHEYADYEFVYENPTGTWFTSWSYRRIGNKPAGTHGVWTYSGTAPIDDALIAIKPTGGDMPAGVVVRNESGIGFEVRKVLARDRWYVFDTFSWSMREGALNADGPWWSGPKTDQTSMVEHGRGTGTALTITPGIADNAYPRGKVTIRIPSSGEIRVATRSKWF